MGEENFMGLDFGTQAVRCGIFDKQGQILSMKEVSYRTYYPRPGWAEQSPDDWISCMKQAIGECYCELGEGVFARLKGMAVCTTSSTAIALDERGQVLADAIIWMDNRAAVQADTINRSEHEVLRYCGGEVSVEWLLPKMMWIKDNWPDIFAKAAKIVEFQDYINFYISGVFCASICQATCKSNYVMERGGFDPSFFKAIDFEDFFEKANLNVLEQGAQVGRVRDDLAKALHLPKGLMLYQGGIDAHVNAIGVGLCTAGETCSVLGSSFVHLTLSEKARFSPAIWGPYKNVILADLYCLEGGQVSAGSISKWFIKTFDIRGDEAYRLMSDEAKEISVGSEGLLMLDFFQGNRTPFKNSEAKGAFYGLTLRHTRAHLYRAMMEGVAFGTKNIVNAMEQSGQPISTLRCCGGVTHNPLWLQIIADVTGKKIILTQQSGYAGVLGCAIIAAIGSSTYADFPEACKEMVRVGEVFEAVPENHGAYECVYARYLELCRSLKIDRKNNQQERLLALEDLSANLL